MRPTVHFTVDVDGLRAHYAQRGLAVAIRITTGERVRPVDWATWGGENMAYCEWDFYSDGKAGVVGWIPAQFLKLEDGSDDDD